MPRSQEPFIEVRRYELADGTFTETFSLRWYDVFGKRRRKTCASKEEAEFERARIVLEKSRGGAGVPTAGAPAAEPEPSGYTIAMFWQSWIADARVRLQRNTVKEYERQFRTRLEPRFGSLPLDALKPRMVSQWRAELVAEGVGPEAIRRAMTLLQAMYSVAIEWGEASANPVSVVRKPRQGRRRAVQPLAPEAVEKLRAEIGRDGDLRSATLVSVLAYAGLRPGEALGLERRHIRENTILIEQAVSDGDLKVQKTGRNFRTVDLLSPLASDLERWFEQAKLTEPDALIFARADETPWRGDDWDNWRNRRFFPCADRAGLGHPRPYDLRHSFASLLIREQKTSIVELADQLGHAPTMTLNTYAHVFAEHRRAEPVDITEWIERARAEARGDA
ncbi:MAG: tyrosine-type recombinase/integrase [Solirubrobacteraceae bacterium]